MISEMPNPGTEGTPQEPRRVQLGETFHPFQLQQEGRWDDYSAHLSMVPSIYTSAILATGLLPDLNIHSVVQAEGPRKTSGTLFIDGDKNQLGKLGALARAPHELFLPMPPAVYGGSRWDGYYILDPQTLETMRKLKVHVATRDGEYEAHPTIYQRKTRMGSTPYATGITFEHFATLQGKPTKKGSIPPVSLRDEAALQAVAVTFTAEG